MRLHYFCLNMAGKNPYTVYRWIRDTKEVTFLLFRITDIPLLEYEYLYMADGEVFADPYAKLLSGLPEFGIKDTTGLQHIKGLLKKLQYKLEK